MTNPLTMFVNLYIEKDRLEEYLESLAEVLPQARAEEACQVLFVTQEQADPTHIILFEVWRDRDEYFDEVLSRDYFQKYLAASEDAYAKSRLVHEVDLFGAAEDGVAGPAAASHS